MKLELLANRILSHNPKCALSGSLALRFHGIKLRNEPQDIDIYCPFGVNFKSLDEMDFQNGDDYPSEEENTFKITQYLVGKIKVDVFKPNTKKIRLSTDVWPSIGGELRFINKEEILKFKILFALGTPCDSQQKHLEDLAYILKHNCKNSNNQLW